MKGKHKIEVRSGRVVFTIELERNITILRGDSATGKTTLVEMLQAYETYGRQSGVTLSCDKPCRVLSGVNWELQLNATHDSIMFVDENAPLVTNSLEAALPPKSAINKLMNIIANDKRQEMNNKTDSQPVDDLKARKLAILLDK